MSLLFAGEVVALFALAWWAVLTVTYLNERRHKARRKGRAHVAKR